jgi:catechol-2,3-dioxygenase
MGISYDIEESIQLKRFSHAAIGVSDLYRQKEFYTGQLGLSVVTETPERIYLRAAGSHHHVLELANNFKGLHHMAFEVKDDCEIDRARHILTKRGIRILHEPKHDAEPGIGRLLRFNDPEGNTIELVSNVIEHAGGYGEKPVKPLTLDHVTFFAGNIKKQENFYIKLFGMRVSDRVPGFLTFLTCDSNHHSLGFITLPHRGFQHIAFDYADRTDMMNALVHLNDAGCKRVDGPGRHGPGNSLFTYFEDPEKNLVELIAEAKLDADPLRKPGEWKQQAALNLWRSGGPMGPPPGMGWVVHLLPYISRLVPRGK